MSPGLLLVADALVGPVVGVHEERVPAAGQLGVVHREAVVLGGDVAPPRAQVHARLVPQKKTRPSCFWLALLGRKPGF